MNPQERLDLNRLLSQSEAIDNTKMIREVQHSGKLLDGLREMEVLKRDNRGLRAASPAEFAELCQSKCGFYFANYANIFNKQLKDELNLAIMIRFIRVLELIETDQVDQHEGSVMIGKYLKELYVDSAVRRGENLDREHADDVPEKQEAAHSISWAQYKSSQPAKI